MKMCRMKIINCVSVVTRSRVHIPSRDVNIQADDVTHGVNYADVDEVIDYDHGDSFINPDNVENALKFNVSDTGYNCFN
jgi:hypothetical protein